MKTKIEPLVNLNVNPCKMCMPMGAATAFYGIKKCMNILHGSQGCSTYIRRHMATHYNEPVDIASSSLTEHGTVYGGEENLLKGLSNLIELYHPQIIGVSTTCLAETIGEDVPRIIEKFYETHKEYQDIEIIPVNSPGYGGTQFEGYFRALYGIVSNIKMDSTPNDYINVITSPISPADTRFIKEAFGKAGIPIILLPDISENLDGVYKEHYDRLPSEGTDIEEIRKMAGAKLTIELCGLNVDYSPGKYLEKEYKVPCVRMNLPVGIRDTDAFYLEIAKHAFVHDYEMEIEMQRGRYLDAMVDAHKYNGDGRAVIFGEPDFVVATVRLCVENGVMPLIVATGSVCKELKNILSDEIRHIADRYFIDRFEILDDVDFKIIEAMAESLEANLLIGNSDGRRMEESLQIPLVRRAFPIHDRVGGQRLRMLGYEGSLTYLDDVANAVLSRKERNFRKDLYHQYYKGTAIDEESEFEFEKKTGKSEIGKSEAGNTENGMQEAGKTETGKFENGSLDTRKSDLNARMLEKTKNHPCFNGCNSSNARIHLPVAPKCNIQCNYCVRKFDCPNESRPGVTTKILTPEEAYEKYKIVKAKLPNLTVVGIAGPGDALANFEETKRTLQLIREFDPEVTFCLSTNGLMLPQYANELIELGVSHVTVTLNAVDTKIGAQIYKFIQYNGVKFEGESAAAILLTNQLSGLRLLVAAGIICKVNIVTLKGINDTHIPEIVKTVNDIGCYITNIMPFIQVEGSAFEHLETLSNKEINKIRNECGLTMKQMYHCKQCRADAIGTLGNDISIELEGCKSGCGSTVASDITYKFAVASKSGMLVDSHFGQVNELYVYEFSNGEAKFKEKRQIQQYCTGSDQCDSTEDKISMIINTISDCNAVIAMRIGESPKKKLKDKNIHVFATYDRIETAVKVAAESLQVVRGAQGEQ